jgi:hypothetical protein
VDELGITMSGIPPTETDFYPRSAVRRVSVSANQGAPAAATAEQPLRHTARLPADEDVARASSPERDLDLRLPAQRRFDELPGVVVAEDVLQVEDEAFPHRGERADENPLRTKFARPRSYRAWEPGSFTGYQKRVRY